MACTLTQNGDNNLSPPVTCHLPFIFKKRFQLYLSHTSYCNEHSVIFEWNELVSFSTFNTFTQFKTLFSKLKLNIGLIMRDARWHQLPLTPIFSEKKERCIMGFPDEWQYFCKYLTTECWNRPVRTPESQVIIYCIIECKENTVPHGMLPLLIACKAPLSIHIEHAHVHCTPTKKHISFTANTIDR